MRESDAIRKMEMPKIERDSCFIVAQYELERETEGLETRRENSSKIFAFIKAVNFHGKPGSC
jgi:hypothetical protein